MACLSKTRAALDTMTASERKLAQLILSDPHLVMSGSAKTIGESCGTSAASVVRFAQMLGFDSLREMKIDLRNDIAQEMAEEQHIHVSFGMPLDLMAPRICQQIASGMQTTVNMQSYPDLERAVQMLWDAQNVYIYGIGASSLPALDLQQKLVRVNKRAVYREDQDLGILDAHHMTEKDLMIAFSYSGAKERVNKAVRVGVKRGMKCIAVTRFGRSPLANMATLTLPLPENEKPILRYAAVQSKYAALLVVDLLFAQYVSRLDGDLNELFQETGEIVHSV